MTKLSARVSKLEARAADTEEGELAEIVLRVVTARDGRPDPDVPDRLVTIEIPPAARAWRSPFRALNRGSRR